LLFTDKCNIYWQESGSPFFKVAQVWLAVYITIIPFVTFPQFISNDGSSG
jgi:hypothetical protein